MSSLLPEIGVPLERRPSPVAEVTNPGTSSPHAQQFVAPIIDQTKKVTRLPGPIVDSNGDGQRLNLSPGQQGIGVTAMPMFRGSARGEHYHHLNREPIDQGIRVRVPAGGRKPVATVMVANQNVSRPRPTKAVVSPLSVTVDAGRAKAGGLATNHNIK